MGLGTAALLGLGGASFGSAGGSALLAGAGIAGGFGASKLMGGSKSVSSSPTPLPQPPSVDATAGKAEKITKAKRAMSTQSVYSNPLGIGGMADVSRKTLLGQ